MTQFFGKLLQMGADILSSNIGQCTGLGVIETDGVIDRITVTVLDIYERIAGEAQPGVKGCCADRCLTVSGIRKYVAYNVTCRKVIDVRHRAESAVLEPADEYQLIRG